MGGLDRGEAMVSLLVKLETDEDISGWGEVCQFKTLLLFIAIEKGQLGKLDPKVLRN